MSVIPGELLEEAIQFSILTKHFFVRLFRNDTVEFEDQMKERLIVVLVTLAVIIGYSSQTVLFKYHFVPDANRSWQEKTYIFTLMMIFFGIVTVLEWDILFPDRRDFLNLAPMPVRWRTVFLAKMASFVAFVGLFSVAMTSFSSLLFSMYLTEWRANSLILAGRYVISHVVSGFAANFVVFFGFIFLQFFLMALLPQAFYKRISLLVRFLLLAALVFILLGFLVMPAILGTSFASLETLKANGDPFLYRFPPLWFVGLYEVILGTSDQVFVSLAGIAGAAVLLSLVSFILASALSYRRHLRKTLDLGKAGRPFLRFREIWSGILHRILRMPPEERAVHGFFGLTLGSSSKHRMTFSYYLAVGAATALVFTFAFVSKGWLKWIRPSNGFVLVLPLMIAFVLIVGIRSLVNIPVAAEANWIFRLTETPHRQRYITGLKKSVFLKLAIPLSLAVFLTHQLVWGIPESLLHSGFILGFCLVGIEAAFFRFRKIPFACTYLPGKSRIYLWGFPCAIGVVIILTLAARLEIWLFDETARFLLFFLGVAAVIGIARFVDRLRFPPPPLIYEEEPEPALVGFPETG
jgi:hypothetical protein